MSNPLANLDVQQLKALLSTLVELGVSEVDAEQALMLVDDIDTEEQDVELEFVYKGRPTTVVIKVNINHYAAPAFAIVSADVELANTLAAAL